MKLNDEIKQMKKACKCWRCDEMMKEWNCNKYI